MHYNPKNDDQDRGGLRGGDMTPADDHEIDTMMAAVMKTFDQGEQRLRESYYTTKRAEQVSKARQARTAYQKALKELQSQHRQMRRLPGWQAFYDQVQRGLDDADRRLQDLGQ